MKIEVELNHYYFKLMIDGLPHVVIEAIEYKGFHAWSDSNYHCSIEWVTTKNKFITEYDSIEKWKQVLQVLNDNL